MHALCIFCGSPECTCFDTDEEYLAQGCESCHRRPATTHGLCDGCADRADDLRDAAKGR